MIARLLILFMLLYDKTEPQTLQMTFVCRGRVKLAVIDHVASFPPVLFDVKGLSSLCKGTGAKGAAQDVLVTDGEDAD